MNDSVNSDATQAPKRRRLTMVVAHFDQPSSLVGRAIAADLARGQDPRAMQGGGGDAVGGDGVPVNDGLGRKNF